MAAAAAFTITASTIGTYSASPASASPGSLSAKVDCFDIEPDDYNGQVWKATTTKTGSGGNDYWGEAVFREYGEILYITDWDSNGWRTTVDFYICYNGKWRYDFEANSGPDEGIVDTERINLAYKDGRRLRMRVCERKITGGTPRRCGYPMEMVA
jgi:hypothetical protein